MVDSLDVSDINRTFKASTKFSKYRFLFHKPASAWPLNYFLLCSTEQRNPLEPAYSLSATRTESSPSSGPRRNNISYNDVPFTQPFRRSNNFQTRDSSLNISDIEGARPRTLHPHRNRASNPEFLQSSDISQPPYPNQKALSLRATDPQSPRYKYAATKMPSLYGAIEKVHPNPGRSQRQDKNLFAGTTLGIPEATPQWKTYSQPVRRGWRDINQTADIPGAQVPKFSAVAMRKTNRHTNPNQRNYQLVC